MEHPKSETFTFHYHDYPDLRRDGHTSNDKIGATQIYNQVKGQRNITDTRQAGSDCVIGK